MFVSALPDPTCNSEKSANGGNKQILLLLLLLLSTTSNNQWLRNAGEHLSLPYMTDVENRFYDK